MSNYRRLISYIYAYEGGIKGKNVGFAKLEVRNGQCKIQVNVRNVFIGSQDTGVFLLCDSKELLVGKIFIRNGAGEFRAIVPVNNIAGSGRNIDQCYGLTVHNLADSWQSYTTIWEDAVAHTAEVALEDATSEKIEQNGQEAEERNPSVAQAVEAEIEAQSRLEEQTRRKREESDSIVPLEEPETVIAPLEESEPAEVGAMEIRPMEVRPIGGYYRDDSEEKRPEEEEKESETAKQSEENGIERESQTVFGIKEEDTVAIKESAVSSETSEKEELPLDTVIPGETSEPELKIFFPRESETEKKQLPQQDDSPHEEKKPPQDMTDSVSQTVPPVPDTGVREEESQTGAVQQSRQDRMNLFGLPGWWGQQGRQTLGNPLVRQNPQNRPTSQEQQNPQNRPNFQEQQNPQNRPASQEQQNSRNRQNSRERQENPAANQNQGGRPLPGQTGIWAEPGPQPRMDPPEEEPRIETIWQQFYKRYPKIQAFDYNGGCEILTIKPQDIGLLPREIWGYGNNSFLLHGYYSHRYIIFARLGSTKGRPRYLLGVPGHYYSNEKYMASMFGFPNFVLSKIQPEGDGRFGYWYTDVHLG